MGSRAWVTRYSQLSDALISAGVAGTLPFLVGAKSGITTRFAVLDIDKSSKYHTIDNLCRLRLELLGIGLQCAPYRSSDSGGWHVYLFFDEQVPSKEARELLTAWLKAKGYEIKHGTLEVFPSGMGLRLPLQRGFAWLDDLGNVQRLREQLTTGEALASFLFDLEQNKSNWSVAKYRIASQLAESAATLEQQRLAHQKSVDLEGFEPLFSSRLIPERYEAGREFWRSGLNAAGQRHDAILAVEHYLWHGDREIGLRALPGAPFDNSRFRLIRAWLEENHNGFCRHINAGNWAKVEANISRAVRWRREEVRTPYAVTERAADDLIARSKQTGRTWTPDDFKKGNEGRESDARARITLAVQSMAAANRRLLRNEIAREAGCSPNTVSKHRDLWAHLATGSSDQNPFYVVPGKAAGNSEAVLEPVLCEKLAIVVSAEAGCTSDPVLKQSTPGIEMLPSCLGMLLAQWRRRGTETAVTARICGSPLHTQPSMPVKKTLCTCGLNGFLPTLCAGPLHLNPRRFVFIRLWLAPIRQWESSRGRAPPAV